jgi:hypothetical protein
VGFAEKVDAIGGAEMVEEVGDEDEVVAGAEVDFEGVSDDGFEAVTQASSASVFAGDF